MTKPAKCKICKGEYQRLRPLQSVCSIQCSIDHGRVVLAKANEKEKAKDRKEVKQKLDAMQTKPQLTKKAQTAFNAFIRARDAGKPCICCGRPLGAESNTFDAGHYRSVGSAPHMRFVEDNVHGQTKYCNNHLGGNHVAYRQGLIERIGLARVEQIEADNTIRKYTKEGLIELARYYRAEARRIAKENGQ